MRHHSVYLRSMLFVVLIGMAGAVPLFSRTFTPSTTITINNNAGVELRHVYFSAVDNDNWGGDQLNGSVISNGASYTLNNVSCESAEIKVIAEDQNGCFFYQNVTCGQSSTWALTTSATPDCGN
jgi:hypothetical protein